MYVIFFYRWSEYYRIGDPDLVYESVVREVAERKGVEVDHLTPLSEVIDTDAIIELFGTPTEHHREIRFKYEGYIVRITNDATVSLTQSKA